MKKLLTLILVGMLCVATGLFAACAPPADPAFVEQDLNYGVSFTSTAWADSDVLSELTTCTNSEARIYTNTDTNAEIVNGLKFKEIISANEFETLTANDVIIGALMCPASEIQDLLVLGDNDKIADVKLYEKSAGSVKVNGVVQNGNVYELVCHVRDFPADGSANTLDIACVFYIKIGTEVIYSSRIDSTLELAALNSLNNFGANYKAGTITTLEGLIESETCTVSFDANGGADVPAIKVFKGGLLIDSIENIESTMANMQFVKWQIVTTGEGGEEILADYNEETFVNEDITLKALFTNPIIATAEDFITAIKAGAGDYTFSADIDLTEVLTAEPWAGEGYFKNAFNGNIDGAGHKLTGITGQSDGQTACYGFFSNMGGTISNLYIELDVKYPAWNGSGYGGHPFGTIAHFFYGRIENCVISFSQSLESPNASFDLNNVGLFSYFCAGASMEDVLLIDRTTDPALTKSALITSIVAGGWYELDINNVVYVKTNGITNYTDMMMPTSHDAYEIPAKDDINNFYVVGSLADAVVQGAGYVLSDAYLTAQEYTNDDTTWTANTAVAADCLSVVTFADNKVMFGDVEIAEYFVPQAISTAEELYNVFNSGVEGSFYLANDIDMYDLMETEAYSWGVDGANGVQYAPNCAVNEFNATLDGRNHKITGIHGIDGGNANYGFIRDFFGKLTNCYIEITARYATWQGTYGSHAFGTLANNFYGEVSNCVIRVVTTSNGSSYHQSQGLFAQVSESAIIKNVLVIDDSTDAYMEFRPLLSGYANYVGDGTGWAYENVEDVVYVRTHLGITVNYAAFMNGFAYLLPPNYKSTAIKDFYYADSFEEAITENGSYTLSDAYYAEENVEPNSESYWEISSNKAMDCLSGITYAEGVVKLNGRAVYVVED